MGARKVLVAVDHSAESAYAVRWSLAHCLRDNDDIVVLHVRAPTSVFDRHAHDEADSGDGGGEAESQPAPAAGGDATVTIAEKIKKVAQTYQEISEQETERMAQSLKEAGKTFTVRVVEDENAKERICKEAAKLGVDLLIIGSRGLGFIKRTLLGSTCDYCLQHSSCPVLAVKRPQEHRTEVDSREG